MAKYPQLSPDDQGRARALELSAFLGRGRRRERVFKAIDVGRAGLKRLRLNPSDAEAVGAFAAGYAESQGLIEWLTKRKADLATETARQEAIALAGRFITAKYFRARQVAASSAQSILALAVSEAEVREILEAMNAVSPDAQTQGDVSAGVRRVVDALSIYETAVPLADEDGSIPDRIQDRGITEAAFLGIRAEELKAIIAAEASDASDQTKSAIVEKLVEIYAGREDDIARVLAGHGPSVGDGHRVVQRLIPLEDQVAGVADLEKRVQVLIGRYFETAPAEWLLFTSAQLKSGGLQIGGRLFGYRVDVQDVKDEARLQPRKRDEPFFLTVRNGEAWAELTSRSPRSVRAVRRVLRNIQIGVPVGHLRDLGHSVDEFDAQSVWALDLIRKGYDAQKFEVLDHILVRFERPNALPDDNKPDVQSIQLKGRLLVDHPEVCALLVDGRRITELELVLGMRLRQTRTEQRPALRVKLQITSDHLAVISSFGSDAVAYRPQDLVLQSLKHAVETPVDSAQIQPMLTAIRNLGLASPTPKLDPQRDAA